MQNIVSLHEGHYHTKDFVKQNQEFNNLFFTYDTFCLLIVNSSGKINIKLDQKETNVSDENPISILLMSGSSISIKSSKDMEISSFYFQINSFFTFKNKIDKLNLKINQHDLYTFNNIFSQRNPYYKTIVKISESIMELAGLNNQNYNADVQYLLWDLIHLVENEMFFIGYGNKDVPKRDNDIEKIVSYIEKSILDQKISIDDLCKKANISKPTLNRKFKKEFDCTPYSYILKKKLYLAKRMIENSSQSISDISYNLGFQNLVTFDRSFKKEFKKSPISLKKNK